MEEKKTIKISLGTVICMVIIVILICVIFGMLYYYNGIRKTSKNQTNIEQTKLTENENIILEAKNNNTMELSKNTEKNNNIDTNETYINNDEEKTKSVYDNISKLEYTRNWKDDENGKIAILKKGKEEFLGNKTEDGYYSYTDAFSNNYRIKTITDIVSKFYLANKDETVMLYKCQIKYITPENIEESFYSAVVVPIDTSIEPMVWAPFDNYTGTTNFVKTFGTNEYIPGM